MVGTKSRLIPLDRAFTGAGQATLQPFYRSYEDAINRPSPLRAFTVVRSVPFSTRAGLDSALAAATNGDYIFYNGTGVLLMSASADGYNFTGITASCVVDFGNYYDANHVKSQSNSASATASGAVFSQCQNVIFMGGDFTAPTAGAGMKLIGCSNCQFYKFVSHNNATYGVQIIPASSGTLIDFDGNTLIGETFSNGLQTSKDTHTGDPGSGLHAVVFGNSGLSGGALTSPSLDTFAGTTSQDTNFTIIDGTTTFSVIRNNGTDPNAATGYAWDYWNVQQFAADQEAWATIKTVTTDASSTLVRVGGRITGVGTSAHTGYYVNIDKTGVWSILLRPTTGGSTTLATGPTQIMSNGDSVGIRIVGSVIEAWYKPSGGSWGLLFNYDTTSDATRLTGAGYTAVQFRSSILDDFGAGVASVAPSMDGNTIYIYDHDEAIASSLYMGDTGNGETLNSNRIFLKSENVRFAGTTAVSAALRLNGTSTQTGNLVDLIIGRLLDGRVVQQGEFTSPTVAVYTVRHGRADRTNLTALADSGVSTSLAWDNRYPTKVLYQDILGNLT